MVNLGCLFFAAGGAKPLLRGVKGLSFLGPHPVSLTLSVPVSGALCLQGLGILQVATTLASCPDGAATLLAGAATPALGIFLLETLYGLRLAADSACLVGSDSCCHTLYTCFVTPHSLDPRGSHLGGRGLRHPRSRAEGETVTNPLSDRNNKGRTPRRWFRPIEASSS